MRGLLVFLIGFFIATAPAYAAGKQTPEEFLNSIYAHYQGDPDQAKGVFIGNDEGAYAVFEPWLADKILRDAGEAQAKKRAPDLDGDPFVDGQSWDIHDLTIKVTRKPKTAKKADAVVRFTNSGFKKEIHISLVLLPVGWRIHDIYWGMNEGTLREIYEIHKLSEFEK